MPCASKRDNAMPAIRPLAKFVGGKPGQVKGILPSIARRAELTERQDGREGFRCPEDRLPVERLFRIGREKRAPIFFEIGVASHLIARRLSDF